MLTKKQAIAEAIAAGAEQTEIDRQAQNYVRQVGTVPFKNMIRALNMCTWHNTKDDWTRLAAAMTAKGLARKR